MPNLRVVSMSSRVATPWAEGKQTKGERETQEEIERNDLFETHDGLKQRRCMRGGHE
jgi:hypothetical protein